MKVIKFFLFFILFSTNCSFADINKEFENWKLNFKKIALENNISEQNSEIIEDDQDNNSEEDELEIPAFLRRQKN